MKGVERTMQLHVNRWIEGDLTNAKYHVIEVLNKQEWWILYSTDDLEEAKQRLAEEIKDNEDKEHYKDYIINYLGEHIAV